MTTLANRLRITHSDSCGYLVQSVGGEPVNIDCTCGADIRNEAADRIEELEATLSKHIGDEGMECPICFLEKKIKELEALVDFLYETR
jgi:hypothetical protein